MEGKSHRYQVKALTDEENAKQKKVFKYFENGCKIRVGPAGYVLPAAWLDHSEAIRTAPIRPDDVFVVSCPRSGTTWTQELVWLVANDMNFDKAKSLPLIYRFPFLEFSLFEPSVKSVQACPERLEETRTMAPPPSLKDLASSPSPRFMKSHLPLSLLPEGFLDTAKVIYVARDPRDVAVSCYYFYKNLPYLGTDALFKEFWELFINDLAPWNPHLAHVKEAWQQRHHPNMLFLFYEELSKDLGAVARRVAGFLGKQYTDDQYDALLDHLKIDNFRKNNAVNREYRELEADKFIRKGKAGGWRDEFDEGMTERAERWMTEQLRGTGMTFQ